MLNAIIRLSDAAGVAVPVAFIAAMPIILVLPALQTISAQIRARRRDLDPVAAWTAIAVLDATFAGFAFAIRNM